MSSYSFRKTTPTFDKLSLEFWKREVVDDLFLTMQHIVAGIEAVSKKILSETCLQCTVELSSNSPRIILQYDLKCDENETVLMIPLKDYQTTDENTGTVDDGNIIGSQSITTFDEIENTSNTNTSTISEENDVTPVDIDNNFTPICYFKNEIPELLSVLNDNEEMKDKNVVKKQIAFSAETNINSSSTSDSENNVEESVPTVQTKEENRNSDDVIQNKRAEEILTNKVIKRKKPNAFSCNYCDKSFKRKTMKQRHERIHTSETSRRHSKCGQLFSLSSNLLEQKSLTRKTCDQSFSESRTEVHRSTIHTGVKAYKCEECGKYFTWEHKLTTHLRIHPGVRPFKCGTYGKSFAWKYSLVDNTIQHSNNKPFACEIYSKSFSRSQVLKYHTRIHTGERSFKCGTCGKSFTQSSTLVRHTRIHTSEKSYTYDVCGKSFTCSSTLFYHTRIHTGEKPYTCDVCGKLFTCSSALVYHTRIHTGEKTYTCDVCGKSFTCSSAMVRHTRIHTSEKPYTCDVCGKSFTCSSNLTRD